VQVLIAHLGNHWEHEGTRADARGRELGKHWGNWCAIVGVDVTLLSHFSLPTHAWGAILPLAGANPMALWETMAKSAQGCIY
jgi:hypothetical protein